MRLPALPLAVLCLILLCHTVTAQRDSSRIDIGWMSLDRNLTQTITVKGSDLEKMPFMNLADAIRAWFFGAYTNVVALAYVVDGNPVTDVNLYPIFEIEEVTLVQNAVGPAAYGSGQQWLVVVTTKRGRERKGLRVVGQAGPVNANGNGTHTTTNVYHQYYAGMYGRLEKVEYGLSADWIRDVSPIPTGHSPGAGYQVTTPLQVQQWKFNGYLSWHPAKGHTVAFQMGYAPERLDQQSDSILGSTYLGTERRLRGHLLTPQLSWKGELLPGLQEELHVGYLSSSYSASSMYSDSTIGVTPPYDLRTGALAAQTTSQLFFQERLGYSVKAGEWSIRPALNLFYNHIDEKSANSQSTFSTSGSGPVVINPPAPLGPEQGPKGDLLYLSPAVDVGFGRAIDLQAGMQVNLKNGEDVVSKAVFPFASLGVDVLKFGQGAGNSMKLFGSYAQRAQVFVDDYSLYDLSGGGGSYSLGDVYRLKAITPFNFAIPLQYPASLWSWQAGASFATRGDKFRVSYTFERRNFNTPHYFAIISSTASRSYAYVPLWQSDLHHLDIRLKVTDGKGLRWETGLGITGLRNKATAKLPDSIGFPASIALYVVYPQGERTPDKFSWTGGWVNRLHAGAFEFGLDILYHFGEHPYEANGYGGFVLGPRVNSVMTPNVFVGYQWKLQGTKLLEIFLSSRGLARSKSSDVPDDRRYYTLGGSFAL